MSRALEYGVLLLIVSLGAIWLANTAAASVSTSLNQSAACIAAPEKCGG